MNGLVIDTACKEAYKKAGVNAYFDNGFRAGVKFAELGALQEEDLVLIEFALNSLVKSNKEEFEMSAQVEEWESVLEKVRK